MSGDRRTTEEKERRRTWSATLPDGPFGVPDALALGSTSSAPANADLAQPSETGAPAADKASHGWSFWSYLILLAAIAGVCALFYRLGGVDRVRALLGGGGRGKYRKLDDDLEK